VCSSRKYLVGLVRNSIDIITRLGSEAMEGAIKLARQVGISLTLSGSFLQ
jgi:acetylornithine/succinyldiaminopimelate/putrescine aminotransferase